MPPRWQHAASAAMVLGNASNDGMMPGLTTPEQAQPQPLVYPPTDFARKNN
jgi:hypothetical protein